MEEYQDCLKRARRLAVAREATLAGSDAAMSVVTMEDLLIYTRWLICVLHSVKAMHSFIRVSINCLEVRRVGHPNSCINFYCGAVANNVIWSQNQCDFQFGKVIDYYLSCSW